MGTEADNLVRAVREGQNRETDKKNTHYTVQQHFFDLLMRVQWCDAKQKGKCRDACKVDCRGW